MATELDLTTPLTEVLLTPRGTGTGYRSRCAVFPGEPRETCCGRKDDHLAEAFLRLGCGCAYTFCRRALVTIYGPVKLRKGMCPRHGNAGYPGIEAYWLGGEG